MSDMEEGPTLDTRSLANFSHEIRTPLGAILGFSELLRDPELSRDEMLRYVGIIHRNGVALGRLIDDVLDLSSGDAEPRADRTRSFALATLVTEVAETLRTPASEKGLVFVVTTHPGVPATLTSDPGRLRQVLLSAISNAVKFTPEGHVRVDIRVVQAAVGAPTLLEITVEDSGCGIAPEARAGLFRVAAPAESSTTRAQGGGGHGLAFARRVARLLGGDVVLAHSAVGVGSTFVVTVAADLQAIAAGPVPELLAGVRVLVAEDAPDTQASISRLLTARGATVQLVDNGAAAIDAALAGDFDVVLMDIQRSLVDGFDATRALRGQGYDRPILALTAPATHAERQASRDAGCDEHLTKPIDRERLIGAVDRLSGRSCPVRARLH